MLPIADAVRAAFPVRDVDAAAARVVVARRPAAGDAAPTGPVAVFGPDGTFLALVEDRGATTKALAVFV